MSATCSLRPRPWSPVSIELRNPLNARDERGGQGTGAGVRSAGVRSEDDGEHAGLRGARPRRAGPERRSAARRLLRRPSSALTLLTLDSGLLLREWRCFRKCV